GITARNVVDEGPGDVRVAAALLGRRRLHEVPVELLDSSSPVGIRAYGVHEHDDKHDDARIHEDCLESAQLMPEDTDRLHCRGLLRSDGYSTSLPVFQEIA